MRPRQPADDALEQERCRLDAPKVELEPLELYLRLMLGRPVKVAVCSQRFLCGFVLVLLTTHRNNMTHSEDG